MTVMSKIILSLECRLAKPYMQLKLKTFLKKQVSPQPSAGTVEAVMA